MIHIWFMIVSAELDVKMKGKIASITAARIHGPVVIDKDPARIRSDGLAGSVVI